MTDGRMRLDRKTGTDDGEGIFKPPFPQNTHKALYHDSTDTSLCDSSDTFLNKNILGNALVLDTLYKIMDKYSKLLNDRYSK